LALKDRFDIRKWNYDLKFIYIATINQIVKESLPPDVKVQKDTLDLISHLSNSFIDLLSDVSNNVCTANSKK